MAKVKFFLKDPSSDKETLIFLVINHDKKRLKYATGEHIHPNAWDFERFEPLTSTKFPFNPGISRRLALYRFLMIDQIGELKRNNEEITPEKLRSILDKNFKKVKEIDDQEQLEAKVNYENLNSYIQRYIKECETGKRLTPKGKKYKDWTKKGFNTLIFHLDKYYKFANRKTPLVFEDITMLFYNDFLNYFNNDDYALNTIGKHIKNIKVIMNASFNEGLHTSLDFKKKSFRTLTEETDAIYLTETEIDTIYNLDLSENKRLEQVRDLFIIGARTALRYGSLPTLKDDNFTKTKDGYFLKALDVKNGKYVDIPLKKQAVDIYQKYEGKLPRVLSNQKMNDYLKEIGKLAGLDSNVTILITKGGDTIELTYKKYKLITTHTARRSAATNMFLGDVPVLSIMILTNHRTETSFMKYIRVTSLENALKMAKHPYFMNDFKKKKSKSNIKN